MDKNAKFIQVRKDLNAKSPSLCLAKWLQVTIHLHNGMTHSCHHPVTHKIPLIELEENPSALHNTKFKKFQRKMMLDGVRPSECDYCWRIEDASPDNISDRVTKSADEWALPYFNETIAREYDENVNPTYIEVSFGNECHFKCAYCSPTVSSAILGEYLKHGHYTSNPHFELNYLKKIGEYPYSKDEHNPYVEAFWKWWPDLKNDLEVFRITGGEPLLNQNTFQFLESIIAEPLPKLDVAINSNLCVPDAQIKRFTDLSKKIVTENKVKKFEVYTSLDTVGPQAEYVRFGLEMDKFIRNMRYVLDNVPGIKIVVMCTFNLFSVPGFEKFMAMMKELKLEYPMTEYTSRIGLSISYLRLPRFLGANVLPPEYIHYVERALDFMMRNTKGEKGFEIFSEFEINQLRRIVEWLKNPNLKPALKTTMQKEFLKFIQEYDSRKGTDFKATFPEFAEFFTQLEQNG